MRTERMATKPFARLGWHSLLLAGLTLAGVVSPALGDAQEGQRGRTRNPHGAIRLVCQTCHTSTSWTPIRQQIDFDHKTTGFELKGLHARMSCRNCHASLVFAEADNKCADCHADIHRRRLGANCRSCHSELGWKVSGKAVKEHQNRFPLTGGHAAVECQSCHPDAAVDRFAGRSTECAACHVSDYRTTQVVNHESFRAGLKCEECHTVQTWSGARFDHGRTQFPLSGSHAALECASCHTNGRFTRLSRDCFSCHESDFKATTNPRHEAAGFSHDCATCHANSQWQGATFNHTVARFQLTGRHQSVECSRCHVNGQFSGTSTGCSSCHSHTVAETRSPNHVAAGMVGDCATCHNTNGWNGAQFTHTARFALTGGHAGPSCQSCHANNVFKGTSTACVSCHLDTYNGTKNPNHAAGGFPQD